MKEAKKCQTAIQVKGAGKTVTYYFLDKGMKEDYHEEVCGGGRKQGIVTGTVTEKGGKKWIVPGRSCTSRSKDGRRRRVAPSWATRSCPKPQAAAEALRSPMAAWRFGTRQGTSAGKSLDSVGRHGL